jgi:CBS domain containing-hemolysin-like protein
MAHLKRVPAVSDRFECCGYSFEVVEMEGHRVRKVLIRKLPETVNSE